MPVTKAEIATARLFMAVNSAVNVCFSLATIWLIYRLNLRRGNKLINLVLLMSINQAFLDSSLVLSSGSTNPDIMELGFAGMGVFGIATQSFSNIMCLTVAYVVFWKKNIVIKKRYVVPCIMVPSLIMGILMGIAYYTETPYLAHIFAFNSVIRVFQIFLNFVVVVAVFCEIYRLYRRTNRSGSKNRSSDWDGGGGVSEIEKGTKVSDTSASSSSEPLEEMVSAETVYMMLQLALRLTLYPMVQALTRIGMIYCNISDLRNDAVSYGGFDSDDSRYTIFAIAVLGPMAGMGSFFIFLSFQSGAYVFLKNELRQGCACLVAFCLCRTYIPPDKAAAELGGGDVEIQVAGVNMDIERLSSHWSIEFESVDDAVPHERGDEDWLVDAIVKNTKVEQSKVRLSTSVTRGTDTLNAYRKKSVQQSSSSSSIKSHRDSIPSPSAIGDDDVIADNRKQQSPLEGVVAAAVSEAQPTSNPLVSSSLSS